MVKSKFLICLIQHRPSFAWSGIQICLISCGFQSEYEFSKNGYLNSKFQAVGL